MKKEKLIQLFAIGLLICNLILIAFIFFNHRRPPLPEGPRNIIIEKLHFDADQIKKYDALIKDHQNATRANNDKMMDLKNQLYSCILDSSSTSTQDSLKSEIGKLQVAMENIHYNHFKDIGALCKPEQKGDYANLIKEIGRLFNQRMMKPRER